MHLPHHARRLIARNPCQGKNHYMHASDPYKANNRFTERRPAPVDIRKHS